MAKWVQVQQTAIDFETVEKFVLRRNVVTIYKKNGKEYDFCYADGQVRDYSTAEKAYNWLLQQIDVQVME